MTSCVSTKQETPLTYQINLNQRERIAANKRAFDEIIGDPYSKHDIVGQYPTLRCNSAIKAVDNSQEGGGGTANPARPNVIDFVCDVECAVIDGLKSYRPNRSIEDLLAMFYETYLTNDVEYFNQQERAVIEQVIGKLLIARKISPVIRYFTALRTKRAPTNTQTRSRRKIANNNEG